MNKKFLRLSLLAYAGMLSVGAVGLAGCSTGNGTFTAANVKLEFSSLNLKLGESKRVKVSVSKGYNAELRWFSSNENIAIVDDGYIFGVGVGTATITAAYGGGYASLEVNVSASGEEETERLNISPTSKAIKVGESFQIRTSVYPEDTTVTFTSQNPAIATVTSDGTVQGVAKGNTTIIASGSNGKTATCTVAVSETGGGGGDTGGRDIAVGFDLNYAGTLKIGSPLAQTDFMRARLDDFNRLTHSNIVFEIVTHEENTGKGDYANATKLPAVFPYASDQTMDLANFQALNPLLRGDREWILNNMGQEAYNACVAGDNVVGYPFSADNSFVMFYNTDVVTDISQIDTIDELLSLAESKNYKVNYNFGDGFYGGPLMMSYNGGESLYQCVMDATGGYTATSTFSTNPNGLLGAKLITKLAQSDYIRAAKTAPTTENRVLATIVDCSNVRTFKQNNYMGSKYAVAPLPKISEDGPRINTFAGYKFYGVNATLNSVDLKMANSVAKFLCSEYCQAKRLEEFYVAPTLTSLDELSQSEPHVQAIKIQKADHAAIPLSAVPATFYSAVLTAVTAIKNLTTFENEDYLKILRTLDSQLNKEN